MKTILSALLIMSSPILFADQPYVPANSVGQAWGSVNGITMFRGNPTRTWYGTGPMSPNTPKPLWRYPDYQMSGYTDARGGQILFTGSGWTGQPVVWERPDGITEVIVGTYDKKVHFINAETGKKTRTPFPVGDLVKGSVTLDPDGFPLLYFGCSDRYYRILSLEGDTPRELWRIDAHADIGGQIMGNDDWDGNGAIIHDHLFIGGENGWIYIYKLNRKIDKATGKVSVNPVKVVQMPGWHPDLNKLTQGAFSIESSVAVFENRAYFANSAGYVIGIDYTKVNNLIAETVFEFWAGDDIDGTPVVDEKGMLYIVVEHELDYGRAATASAKRILEAGQIIKLDPYKPYPKIYPNIPAAQNPSVVWNVMVPPRGTNWGGVWATPALDIKRDVLYVPTHPGDLLALDRNTGKELWRKPVGYHQWSSPAIIDDKLLIGHCSGKVGFSLWDISNPMDPISLWNDKQTAPGGCIESTPAVWKGKIYVGSRDGYIYAFGDK